MPTYTRNYGLAAFIEGDYYLSALDQKRFKIIDNQTAFLSDIVLDGCASGWVLTDATSGGTPYISLSSGYGIINRYIVNTFGDIIEEVKNYVSQYVYLKRRDNIPAPFSSFSTVASIVFADAIAPAVPANLSYTSLYNSVVLQWDINTEPDISEYTIQRIGFSETVSTNEYVDTTVEQDTTYTYSVYAVDLSGNISAASSIIVVVPKNLSIPVDPLNVFLFQRDDALQLFWKLSPDEIVDHYKVIVFELDSEGQPSGSPIEDIVSGNETHCYISGIEQGKRYKVTIHSVSINAILSHGVTVVGGYISNDCNDEVDVNMVVTSSIDDSNPKSLQLLAEWEDSIGSASSISSYRMTIIENGEITSDVINVGYNGLTEHSKSISVFSVNGVSRSILPRTYYTIKVQSVDTNGKVSNGAVGQVITEIALPPSSPRDLSVFFDGDDLLFIWANSYDKFDYNLLSLTRTDNDTGAVIVIESSRNYYKGRAYRIAGAAIAVNNTYELSLSAIDEFGNQSEVLSYSYSTESEYGKPEAAVEIESMSGDNNITITWTPSLKTGVKYYKIWRSDYDDDLFESSSWTKIDEIDETQHYYVDYSAVNGNQYYYHIGIVDLYNQISIEPGDSDWYPTRMTASTAIASNIIISPVNVVVTFVPVQHDAILTWSASTDFFDGYEIFQSTGDKNSWKKVGNAGRTATGFIHTNGLLVNGETYYYIVRKYNNQGQLYFSSSNEVPFDAICLGNIAFDKIGNIDSISQSCKVDISNLSAAADIFLSDWLYNHHHSIAGTTDRRINLSPTVEVSSWVTTDNRVFTTTETIAGASRYVVKVNGSYPTYLYYVDAVNKTIFFEEKLESASSIELFALDLPEVQGELLESRVGSVIADQMTSGEIPVDQLSKIDHIGRDKEELVPLQQRLVSNNMFLFYIKQNDEVSGARMEYIGSALSFYDVVSGSYDGSSGISGTSQLVAATSKGIQRTTNGGSSWNQVYSPSQPVYKLYYSDNQGRYFALGGGNVYVADSPLSWADTDGIEQVNFVKSITENSSIVFISTDIGVYKLEDESFQWEKTSDFPDLVNDLYCIWNDNAYGLSVFSAEKIYSTTDQGITWVESESLSEKQPVLDIFQDGDYCFAISECSLFRRSPVEPTFTKIAKLPAISRKILVTQDSILITSEDGVLKDNGEKNIYTDSDLSFVHVTNLTCDHKSFISISINDINGIMFIGGEKKLLSGDIDSMNVIYEETSGVTPTIFINSEEQKIGWFFDVSSNYIISDYKQLETDKITVANQYRVFRLREGGWLDAAYDSIVHVYVNEAEYSTEKQLAGVPLTYLSNPNFETFTASDANAERADYFSGLYSTTLEQLSIIGPNYREVIADLMSDYRNYYYQILGDVRMGTTITLSYKTYTSYSVVEFEMMPFDVYDKIMTEHEVAPNLGPIYVGTEDPGSYEVDSVTGIFIFPQEYDKHDRLVATIEASQVVNVGENNHEEIDDAMENVNSGPPAKLADVQQTMLMHLQDIIEGKNIVNLHQQDGCGNYIISVNQTHRFDFKDLYSWMNSKDSTVLNNLEISSGDSNERFFLCPTVVVYDGSDYVYAGFSDALVRIDIVTFERLLVDYDGFGGKKNIRDLYLDGTNLMVVTDRELWEYNGVTWELYRTMGIEGEIRKIVNSGAYLLIATTEGIYYEDVVVRKWVKSFNLTDVQFLKKFGYVWLLTGNSLYYTVDGITWTLRGEFVGYNVNTFAKYRASFVIASSAGLRMDNGSFYQSGSGAIPTSLIDLDGSLEDSALLKVNDIAASDDGISFVLGLDDGVLWTYDGFDYIEDTSTGLDTIHKVLYVNNDVWLFGFNLIKVPSLTDPIDIGNGEIF